MIVALGFWSMVRNRKSLLGAEASFVSEQGRFCYLFSFVVAMRMRL